MVTIKKSLGFDITYRYNYETGFLSYSIAEVLITANHLGQEVNDRELAGISTLGYVNIDLQRIISSSPEYRHDGIIQDWIKTHDAKYKDALNRKDERILSGRFSLNI